MKKLAGIKFNTTPNAKIITFSNGNEMKLALGKNPEKILEKASNGLCNFASYLADNSDRRGIVLPANFETQIRDQVFELGRKEFAWAKFGLRVGTDIISWARLHELADPSWIYGPLWTVGYDANGYTESELECEYEGISVVANFADAEKTGVDKRLFLLDHPFDEEYPRDGYLSQEAATAEFLAMDLPGLETFQTDHRDATLMYLYDRTNRVQNQRLILAQGWMRTHLGRRSVGRDSIVGHVYSYDGRWYLRGSYGSGGGRGGVGFSAGLPG